MKIFIILALAMAILINSTIHAQLNEVASTYSRSYPSSYSYNEYKKSLNEKAKQIPPVAFNQSLEKIFEDSLKIFNLAQNHFEQRNFEDAYVNFIRFYSYYQFLIDKINQIEKKLPKKIESIKDDLKIMLKSVIDDYLKPIDNDKDKLQSHYLEILKKFQPAFSPPPSFSSQVKLNVKPKGLKNLGNSCYANSVLQALSATKIVDFFKFSPTQNQVFVQTLRNYLTKENESETSFDFVNLIDELKNVFNQLESPPQSPHPLDRIVSAKFLKYQYQFSMKDYFNNDQQDASEYLMTLLDRIEMTSNSKLRVNENPVKTPNLDDLSDQFLLENCWHDLKQRNNSFLNDLISFVTKKTSTCSRCQHISKNFTINQNLFLEIQDLDQAVDLNTCLDKYFSPQNQDKENSFECSKCKIKSDSTVMTYLSSQPDVLIIIMKRMKYDNKSFFSFNRTGKIHTPLNTPTEINLSQFMDQSSHTNKNLQYQLVSVINHQGSTLNSGHYTATVKNKSSGLWFNISDEVVTGAFQFPPLNPKESYILIYQIKK